jgi:hypothetical protein
MVPAHAKGKGKSGLPATASTLAKRIRDEADTPPPHTPGFSGYVASLAVDSFLNGSPLPPDGLDEAPREPPTSRRKVDVDGSAVPGGLSSVERQTSSSSESSNTRSSTLSQTISSATSVGSRSPVLGEAQGLPQPPAPAIPKSQPSTLAHDPFGYLTEDGPRPTRLLPSTSQPSVAPALSSNAAHVSSDLRGIALLPSSSSAPAPTRAPRPEFDAGVWGPGTADILAHPLFSPGGTQFAHATGDVTPVHRCGYVTFGAGANQKTVDRFTAANQLEAVSLTGERSSAPYHVPLCVRYASASLLDHH